MSPKQISLQRMVIKLHFTIMFNFIQGAHSVPLRGLYFSLGLLCCYKETAISMLKNHLYCDANHLGSNCQKRICCDDCMDNNGNGVQNNSLAAATIVECGTSYCIISELDILIRCTFKTDKRKNFFAQCYISL